MVTQEELSKLDRVFIKHQEGTFPDWCVQGGMDYLDNTFIPVERLNTTSQHYIKICDVVLGYDCFFTEDPRDLTEVASDMRKELEDLCSLDYERAKDTDESLVNQPYTGHVPEINEWSDKHYDLDYTLTDEDMQSGKVRVDAYFVNRMWKINSWDDTGAGFHVLKTFTRMAQDKNDIKRELTAIVNQAKILAKLHGVEL